jgi:hypothetical protein
MTALQYLALDFSDRPGRWRHRFTEKQNFSASRVEDEPVFGSFAQMSAILGRRLGPFSFDSGAGSNFRR